MTDVDLTRAPVRASGEPLDLAIHIAQQHIEHGEHAHGEVPWDCPNAIAAEIYQLKRTLAAAAVPSRPAQERVCVGNHHVYADTLFVNCLCGKQAAMVNGPDAALPSSPVADSPTPTERPVDATGKGRLLLNAYGRACYEAGRSSAPSASAVADSIERKTRPRRRG